MRARREETNGQRGSRSQYALANQILDIVRDRRLEEGDRLAEVALATQLGVSRTPVRAALSLLAQEEIVRARPNQGYVLLKGWTALKSTILAAPSSSDDELYLDLIRERLQGDIPNTVTQTMLLDRFKTSRAVLLRTLSRMAEEGIVTKNKGRGWTFQPAIDTSVAMRNSYDFRIMVEPAALMLETFEIDMVALDRARARHLWLLEQGEMLAPSSLELFAIDAQFHEMMAGFSNNSFFVQAIQHQNRMRRLLEYQGIQPVQRIVTWVKEHMEIMDALCANDRELAAQRMRAHLENAYVSTMKLTAEAQKAAAARSKAKARERQNAPRRRERNDVSAESDIAG
ncbi:GntR family transcriptional regulator [Afifella sp. H1R]|uniref:GntR family transcriptional regulator n=1 Tax=unclassified Afifella TaxID=2624128 RepID=UPI001F3D6163|nr:GntR family transcriptional regulator [Afifella sp. H1R]MCF1505334.1 GntR family transcriptional regulator [Afifella sp. H1R]